MRAEDGGVPGQVIEVVHDNRHKQVDHYEAAEEYEGDEVEIGGVTATCLVRVEKSARGLVPAVALLVTRPAALAGQHDVWPGLASGAPAHSQWKFRGAVKVEKLKMNGNFHSRGRGGSSIGIHSFIFYLSYF